MEISRERKKEKEGWEEIGREGKRKRDRKR